jgi:hypothetical protein
MPHFGRWLKMLIKYKISNGEILEASDSPSHILSEEDGYSIESYEGTLIPICGMMRTSLNTIRLKNKDEYPPVDPVDAFQSILAIGREAQVFSGADLIRLAPVSYTINTLITYKNFWGGVANGVPYAGLKQLGEGLVAAEIITQGDYDKLAGILLEQGIVL